MDDDCVRVKEKDESLSLSLSSVLPTIDHSPPPATLRCVYIARFNPFLTRVATEEEAQGSYDKKRSSSAPCCWKILAHDDFNGARNFRFAAVIDVKGWGQRRENLNWITRNSVGRKIYYADIQSERERGGRGEEASQFRDKRVFVDFWYMHVAGREEIVISRDRRCD